MLSYLLEPCEDAEVDVSSLLQLITSVMLPVDDVSTVTLPSEVAIDDVMTHDKIKMVPLGLLVVREKWTELVVI